MPIESFTGTKVASNPKHWHLFGCPAYILVQDLQTDTAIHHKWKLRSQVGMYLGCLPQHARDVSLVLNQDMGLVSPQFHIKLESNFQTLREKGARLPTSTWQIKCGFVQQPPKASQHDPAPEARAMTRALPMQQPEGAQPTTNDKPVLVPETETNQDEDPEPQELPPLQRSRHFCQPVDQLTYAMMTKLTHANLDCEENSSASRRYSQMPSHLPPPRTQTPCTCSKQ